MGVSFFQSFSLLCSGNAPRLANASSQSRHIKRILQSLLLASVVWGATPAYADTITVISSAPSGPGSLFEAIKSAAPGDTIDFDADLDGSSIPFFSSVELTQDITIDGGGEITLDARRNGNHFTISTGTVTLNGLAFINGAMIPDQTEMLVIGETVEAAPQGGAITVGDGVTVFINDSTFDANSVETLGGAILNNGTLTVNNSIFTNNTAGFAGGGIYSDGQLTVQNSSFFGNQAITDRGGAITSEGPTENTFTNNFFFDNQAYIAGAISVNSTGNSGFLSVVAANSFSSNSATSVGGAIVASGETQIINNTIVDNSAPEGGGIHYNSTSSRVARPTPETNRTFTLLNNTLVSNRSEMNGSALLIENSTGTVNLVVLNNLVSGISNITPSPRPALVIGEPLVLEQCSIIQPTRLDTFSVEIEGNIAEDTSCGGTVATEREIGLGRLFDNGCTAPAALDVTNGCVPTLSLNEDSVAIDTGVPSPFVTTDQRGLARTQGRGIDVGATERLVFTCAAQMQATNTFELSAAIACVNDDLVPATQINITQSFTVPGAVTPIFTDGELEIFGNGFTLDSLFSGRHFVIVEGDVTISDIVLVNGKGILNGGSIAAITPDASVKIVNSTVRNNEAFAPRGFDIFGAQTIELSPQSDAFQSYYPASVSSGAQESLEIQLGGDFEEVAQGGAIFIDAGNVFIDNSVIINNTAEVGGGIFNLNGEVLVVDSLVADNTANLSVNRNLIDDRSTFITSGPPIELPIQGPNELTGTGGEGGGIANSNGELTINNSTIRNNRAQLVNGQFGGNGGGLLNLAEARITNSTFSENSALAEFDNNPLFNNPRTVDKQTQEDGELAQNSDIAVTPLALEVGFPVGEGGTGGAILNEGSLSIENVTFTNNSAGFVVNQNVDNLPLKTANVTANIVAEGPTLRPISGAGGAISNIGGNMVVFSATLSGNSGFIASPTEGSPKITKGQAPESFGSQSQPGLGGGIFSTDDINFELRLNNTTNLGFRSGSRRPNQTVLNSANDKAPGKEPAPGKGPRTSVTVYNSIFVGHGASQSCYGPISFGGTSFSDDASCRSAEVTESTRVNIGDLADNGCVEPQAGESGPTCGLTHALLEGSVAIDAALDLSIFNPQSKGIDGPSEDTDQRGIARPQGSGFDSGAYELNDSDFDSIINSQDNCPFDSNSDQSDIDDDDKGDACDEDIDGDRVLNTADNCPINRNADQADLDDDRIGDICDSDIDGDTVDNGVDNCPLISNIGQSDIDRDGDGNVCDSDIDGDTLLNAVDNCPLISNSDQADFERDGLGNVCDNDDDGDGLTDAYENANGLDPLNSFDRDADPDRDGFTNLEEFGFGTDPNTFDADENGNNIPDSVENMRPVITPIIQLLLLDDAPS